MVVILMFSEWLKLDFMVKSTVGMGIVKYLFRIVEDGFIRRQFIYWEILSGRFSIMLGGWLEFTLMYNGLLSGLLDGSYLPVHRCSVKSRKLTTLRLVSLTEFRLTLFLNNLINAFFILVASGPLVFSKQAKPSSLYKPNLSLSYLSPNLCRT